MKPASASSTPEAIRKSSRIEEASKDERKSKKRLSARYLEYIEDTTSKFDSKNAQLGFVNLNTQRPYWPAMRSADGRFIKLFGESDIVPVEQVVAFDPLVSAELYSMHVNNCPQATADTTRWLQSLIKMFERMSGVKSITSLGAEWDVMQPVVKRVATIHKLNVECLTGRKFVTGDCGSASSASDASRGTSPTGTDKTVGKSIEAVKKIEKLEAVKKIEKLETVKKGPVAKTGNRPVKFPSSKVAVAQKQPEKSKGTKDEASEKSKEDEALQRFKGDEALETSKGTEVEASEKFKGDEALKRFKGDEALGTSEKFKGDEALKRFKGDEALGTSKTNVEASGKSKGDEASENSIGIKNEVSEANLKKVEKSKKSNLKLNPDEKRKRGRPPLNRNSNSDSTTEAQSSTSSFAKRKRGRPSGKKNPDDESGPPGFKTGIKPGSPEIQTEIKSGSSGFKTGIKPGSPEIPIGMKPGSCEPQSKTESGPSENKSQTEFKSFKIQPVIEAGSPGIQSKPESGSIGIQTGIKSGSLGIPIEMKPGSPGIPTGIKSGFPGIPTEMKPGSTGIQSKTEFGSIGIKTGVFGSQKRKRGRPPKFLKPLSDEEDQPLEKVTKLPHIERIQAVESRPNLGNENKSLEKNENEKSRGQMDVVPNVAARSPPGPNLDAKSIQNADLDPKLASNVDLGQKSVPNVDLGQKLASNVDLDPKSVPNVDLDPKSVPNVDLDPKSASAPNFDELEEGRDEEPSASPASSNSNGPALFGTSEPPVLIGDRVEALAKQGNEFVSAANDCLMDYETEIAEIRRQKEKIEASLDGYKSFSEDLFAMAFPNERKIPESLDELKRRLFEKFTESERSQLNSAAAKDEIVEAKLRELQENVERARRIDAEYRKRIAKEQKTMEDLKAKNAKLEEQLAKYKSDSELLANIRNQLIN